MESVQYKEYQLSDLTNLIIEYDRKIENKFRVEIVLLIMEQRKQYYLNIRLPEFDAPADLSISYGNVRKEGDIVYLNDVLSGIQIILKEKESNFSCCTGFYFLMGKEFVYQTINFIDEEYLSFDIDEGKRRRVKREHLYEDEMSNEVVPFQLGMYGHQLTFEINFQYQQFFDTGYGFRCLISKGIWEKNGNTLKLYDPNLKYSFLLLVRNGDLIRIRYQEDTDLYYLFPNKDRMYPFIMR